MSAAFASGCDFFASWSTEAADIANKVYAGTNQNGSTGPPAGTKMTFVGRYLRVITKSELNTLTGIGLSVFFYYENSGTNSIQPSFNSNYLAATTYTQGQTDANDAKNALSDLGIATNNPVYFAVDYDARSNAQIDALVRYFEGVSDTIGGSAVGMYGSVGAYELISLGMNADGYVAPTYFAQSRSSGWSNNANKGASTNIWQWPPGYSPSGNVVINGHSVDGVFAYTTDYGQYPRGGPGPPPIVHPVNTANVTASSSFSQASPQSLIVPKNQHDQIVFSKTYNVSVPQTLGSHNVLFTDSGVEQKAYPVGNYSIDGGSTYNEFGFIFPITGFNFNPGTLPKVVIQPSVDSSGFITLIAAVNDVNFTNPVSVNIALLVSVSPSSAPSNHTVGQKTAYTNINPKSPAGHYSTYRRVSTDSFLTSSSSFAHGLPTIPNIGFWTGVNGEVVIDPVQWSSTGAFGDFGIKMDSSTITVNVNRSVYEGVYLRVYKDNN